jgi:hypothetical protein
LYTYEVSTLSAVRDAEDNKKSKLDLADLKHQTFCIKSQELMPRPPNPKPSLIGVKCIFHIKTSLLK